MKRTTKEFLEWLGLKFGDKIDINGRETAEIIEINGNYELRIDGLLVKIGYLVNKDYEIIKTPILTDKEKAYLSAVVKPFRDRITRIKMESCFGDPLSYIIIQLKKIYEDISRECIILPYFPKNTMYKGMEEGKEYSLEELGL